MYKVDKLTLITGANIRLPKYNLIVTQPTIKDIGEVGEVEFFKAVNSFFPPREPLEEIIDSIEGFSENEKTIIKEDMTDYDHLIFLLKVTEVAAQEGDETIGILELFTTVIELMIPSHKLVFDIETETLILKPQTKEDKIIVIDESLFSILQSITNQVFKVSDIFTTEQKQSEMSEAAKRIAQKIEEGERRIREQKGEVDDDGEVISRIVSILGMKIDLSTIVNMTVYQLLNQFERFNLYSSHQQALQAATAGADVEIENWYKKI